MTVEGWIISMSIAVGAAAFIVLVVFLTMFAVSARRCCRRVDFMVAILDPILERIGFAIEDRILDSMERAAKQKKRGGKGKGKAQKGGGYEQDRFMGYATEAAQLALLGAALWKKLRNKEGKKS